MVPLFVPFTGHVHFTDDLECVRREAIRLRAEGVRILIAMGHTGLTEDIRMAMEVPEVGLVVGGGTHSFLYSTSPLHPPPDLVEGPYPVVVHRRDGSQGLVVQAFWFGKYMGEIKVTYREDGKILHYEGRPVMMDHSISEGECTMSCQRVHPKFLSGQISEGFLENICSPSVL